MASGAAARALPVAIIKRADNAIGNKFRMFLSTRFFYRLDGASKSLHV